MRPKNVQLPKSEQVISEMFDRIAPNYDFLNAFLSGRQDQRWRRHLIQRVPYRPGGYFLDVATGTGDVLLNAMQSHKEYSTFHGSDISSSMLKLAAAKAKKIGLGGNAQFSTMSAENLTVADEAVDCLTISFGLRNVIDKVKALSEFHRALKPDGRLIILELFHPQNSFFSTIFNFYFNKILPLIGGFFSEKQAYTYLPQSVAGFYPQTKLCELISEAGFILEEKKSFLFGSCCILVATKPSVKK